MASVLSCCWARYCLPCCTADGRDNRICDLTLYFKDKRRKLPQKFVCVSPVWFVELLHNIAIARFHAISAALKMRHFTSRPEPRLPSRKDGAWCKIQAITPLSSLTSEVGQRRFCTDKLYGYIFRCLSEKGHIMFRPDRRELSWQAAALLSP